MQARADTLHPTNSALPHEIVGKTALGLLGGEPRWDMGFVTTGGAPALAADP